MNRPRSAAPAAPAAEKRREMIAIAAYYLAEARGFAPGKADLDWLLAEQTIDAMIADGFARVDRNPAELAEGIRHALKLNP
jgi:hypothetical protein